MLLGENGAKSMIVIFLCKRKEFEEASIRLSDIYGDLPHTKGGHDGDRHL